MTILLNKLGGGSFSTSFMVKNPLPKIWKRGGQRTGLVSCLLMSPGRRQVGGKGGDSRG